MDKLFDGRLCLCSCKKVGLLKVRLYRPFSAKYFLRVLPKSVILLNVIGFVIFFAQGLFNMTMIIMLNNTIEYDEWKYEERHDSVISAVRSFATKLASAIDQGIMSLILIISGVYSISQKISALEIDAGTGALSASQVLETADSYIATATSMQKLILRGGIVIVPVVCIAISFVLLRRKYIIDETKYNELVEAIEARDK